ncbi:alkanesulfonate monooxygenase SsuD/methylene tetrahydromethanopterin reductase-like flavin-dependent oxidoreductase (luciferase family) [Catenuloplanes nepalensis]|uniref:Alkanesulfonate monooxygenase SsuD/methylene tetrahydromethanopterin reductase-like flavin-dependent oxidoreductase (Luciferase family) n=1 Tax=Catenuloplanes nepalensis TaxID=587533 RepID=A0ABT9N2S1_9ACTN|nr:LLM class flavin-dependent oxidoreductase [Catenuloplanes nepalensis]MDP9797993.1 alkanesulfonate monooxygenase SsuD/methylene tetrahydromethanopterin reductase-like flavin-dependent oxidoreductase (luciferase family) [Catenuloplanes nepalensis]
MTKLGAVFVPQWEPERLRGVARAADEAGLEELWLWEDCFFESGVASAAAALAWTERLRVVVGLLPAPLRNVALTAMEAANLERMFPGRSMLGLGHGVQDWMGQAGARAGSPVTLMREYATALRALLDGEKVTVSGRYVNLDGVELVWKPASPPPLLVGASGPRSLRLCGEVGDVVILSGGTTPAETARARALIEEGRAAAGRTDPVTLAVYLIAATGDDHEARLRRAHETWGMTDPVADVTVGGDPAEIAAGLRRWADAGADTIVLQPTADEPSPEDFVRFVATELRPLVD